MFSNKSTVGNTKFPFLYFSVAPLFPQWVLTQKLGSVPQPVGRWAGWVVTSREYPHDGVGMRPLDTTAGGAGAKKAEKQRWCQNEIGLCHHDPYTPTP